MVSARTGFDAGKTASKNNVAGRNQKSIAAVSIGNCSSVGGLSGYPVCIGWPGTVGPDSVLT